MSPYLRDYLHYASANEAPPQLHQWAGLMTLSVAMSRKVWVVYGDWNISPNLYVFFVGPPAAGKSVAMELAEKVVHDFTNIEIAPDSITAQKLVETMAKTAGRQYAIDGKLVDYTPITIFSDELVSLLGPEPKNMIDLLTALYSNRSTYKASTIGRGNDHIKAPCVTMICCLTPSFLDSVLTQKLVTGGLARRMTMIYAPQRGKPIPWPVITPEHRAAKARCVEYAKKVQELVGPVHLSDEAREFFITWYENVKDAKMRSAVGIMAEYYGALNITVLKVACLLAVAERPELLIERHHLVDAIAMLDALEPDIMTVLGGGGRNDFAPITRAVEKMIKEHPQGVSIKRIKARFHNDAKDDEIEKILAHLRDVDAIRYEVTPSGVALYFPLSVSPA